MPNHNQTLGLKSIVAQKEEIKSKLKEAFTHDWVFTGWERFLIAGCFVWTAWSFLSWAWRLIV